MTIRLDKVGLISRSDIPFTWTSKDAILYAISVGAGANDASADLAFTTENTRGIAQQVLPTFAVVLGTTGALPMSEWGDFSLAQVLHSGQRITLHGPIPVEGSVTSTNGITAVYDKGKNAIIETTTAYIDVASGQPLAESVTQIIVRGEGGFGGDSGPADGWLAPDRPADRIVTSETLPNQALLFRLNGDRNPLHSDPSFARLAGFDKPILHGLCTYGFAARAIMSTTGGIDVNSFGSFGVRLTSPVRPGDVLETHIWDSSDEVRFVTMVGDTVVLDRGCLTRR